MEYPKPLGLIPPMGWNSWNTFTWDINEQLIRDVTDLFVSERYKDGAMNTSSSMIAGA
jgi:alpha-galactosidase